MNNLKCVKPIGNWDEGLAQQIHAEIQASILEVAEVDEATWREAWGIVMFEGEFGPTGLDIHEEMTVAKARGIVEKAVNGATFHNYPWYNPEQPEDEVTRLCPVCESDNVYQNDEGHGQAEGFTCGNCGHECLDPDIRYEPNCCLDSTTIRREVFAGWFRIYGGS